MITPVRTREEVIPPAVSRRIRRGGFILVSLYMILVVLLIHSVALITHALGAVRMAQRSQAQMQAWYLAEAGLDQAIVQLRADSTWTAGFAAVPIGVTGDYTVAVDNTLPGNRIQLFSSGTTSVSQITNTQTVNAIVSVAPQGRFRYAAFGDEGVTISGSNARTDSYDSDDGPYNVATAGTEGDVGTNSTSAGGITLSGNATVGGDALAGVGGDPTVVIDDGPQTTIVGNPGNIPALESMDPEQVPGGIPNQGDLDISGQTVVNLPGGTYWYDDISISGQGRLNFQGPTTVYLSGQLSVSGLGVGTANDLPTNLVINTMGNANVNISGNADFYGAVYAPQSQISVSGEGGFYGSLIGREVVNSGNGGIHHDEALRRLPFGSGPAAVNVLSWTDQSVVQPDSI